MFDTILQIADSLNKNKVEYVIIGGYALILHGFLGATEGLDIMLKMTEENIEKFKKSLKSIFADGDLEEINFGELKKYPVIRYGTSENFYIDIISGIDIEFSYESIIRESKLIEGVDVYFATAESLYKMKKNTHREKDKLDLVFLKEKLKDDTEIQ